MARPVAVQHLRSRSSKGGINCCCCTVCTCIHLEFLKTLPGLLKVAEVGLGSVCQSLLLRYGVGVSATLGSSFAEFLTTVSSCLLFVAILLFCYVVSSNSFNLIRSSLLEVTFNLVASVLYFTSSAHLSWAVFWYLWPQYLIIPGYAAYPAMSACYIMGISLGVFHGIDSYFAFKHLKGSFCQCWK